MSSIITRFIKIKIKHYRIKFFSLVIATCHFADFSSGRIAANCAWDLIFDFGEEMRLSAVNIAASRGSCYELFERLLMFWWDSPEIRDFSKIVKHTAVQRFKLLNIVEHWHKENVVKWAKKKVNTLFLLSAFHFVHSIPSFLLSNFAFDFFSFVL